MLHSKIMSLSSNVISSYELELYYTAHNISEETINFPKISIIYQTKLYKLFVRIFCELHNLITRNNSAPDMKTNW